MLDHQHALALSKCTSASKPAKWRDRLSGCQWYLSDSGAGVFDINVESAWEATLGEGVTVLVVDYPIDFRHEDLRDNLDPAGSPGLSEAAVVGAASRHGTAMASIIAARDNAVGFRGVAPRAALTWKGITAAQIRSGLAFPRAECVEAVGADGSVEGSWAPDCGSRARARVPAPARFYTFSLGVPSKVTIDLRSSLDAYLYVREGHAQGGASIARDDDSGTGPDARVSRVFPAGVYTVEATTYARLSRSGSFTLQFSGLDGVSAPEAIALHRWWPPGWDVLLEAAVVNRSYSETNLTRPRSDDSGPHLADSEIYDTMAEFGFGGRGTLNVVSGGKTMPWPGLVFWSTLSETRSHPAVVAVCAVDREGRRDARRNTSIEGPSLWVCAPADGVVQAAPGDRYFVSNGTPSSPATALVSGVAALVRSVDSSLSWRDVKLILAASAQHNDPGDAGWQQGAAAYGAPGQRYRYHHSYGFGVVDAGAAVELAQSWRYLPAYRSEQIPAALPAAVTVPDDGTTVTAQLTVDPGIDFVEYVEAHLVLDAPWFRDLEVELESPSGAVSTLSVPVGDVTRSGYAAYDCKQASECGISGSFRFGTAAHLGEDPAGTWTLRLTDRRPNTNTNTLESWSLRFFGHNSADPSPTFTPSPTFDPWPHISITAGSDIDEGGDAVFTVTADPAPAAPLKVEVTLTEEGDYLHPDFKGPRAVTIGTTGTRALTVPTRTRAAKEPDGSVTATLRAVGGYTVSAGSGSATVAVADRGEPEVSITAGANVTEGADVIFTVTADPAPLAALDVTVSVTAAGDFGVTPGSRTVTVPTTGTVTLTVVTTNDSADEADGSVTATVTAGVGYTVSATAGSATVAVADSGEPEVSIAAGSDVYEGGVAVFTVSAVPAPSVPLTVDVAVSQSGDFDVSPGSRTVTVPTSGTATLSVATTDDSVDEADGSVTAAVGAGAGYTVSAAAGSASVAVADDDDPPLVGDGCVVVLSGDGSVSGEWSSQCASSARAGRFARFYSFSLDGAGVVRVDLVSSADAYMYLRRGLGRRSGVFVEFDDDDGDGFDSRISRRLAAGDYTIEATTYYALTAGSFTLTVDGIATQTVVRPAVPEVSITAVGGIAEGGDATFTVSAIPAPAAALTVDVTVSQSGDFGVSPGSHTVTIPASGSVTLTVATTNDSVDEAHGSVTAAVGAGTGYTVSGAAGSASVAVADDDDPAPPPPVVCVPSLPSDAVTVSEVTGWRDGHSGAAHVLRWNRVLAALGVDNGEAAMTVEQSRVNEGLFMFGRWDRVTRTLEALEQCDDPPPPADPEVSVTAGGSVAEGSDAVFTVTASPVPSSPLTVTVTVAQTGDYGAATGTRTVTVPVSGSVTLTVGTTDDSADEPDGSVAATVGAGAGYTVSATAGTAAVAVADDDDPAPPPPATPEVSVTAGSGVTEGGDVAFTVTAVPAPAAPLTVTVTVAQTGDYGTATGTRYVTVPTTGSVTLTVATANDSTDEADGTITATVGAGSGYTVSQTAGTATVAVSDDDPPPVVSKPSITVRDATAGEGDGAVTFTVEMSAAAAATVRVTYWTRSYTAISGADFPVTYGWLTFAAGETAKTVRVPLIDDTVSEPTETFQLRLLMYDTAHAALEDDHAQGTITDND